MKDPTSRERRIGSAFLRRSDFTTFTSNEKLLLNLVRSKGPISRSSMAKLTDLTMQSVVRLVEGLVERQVLAAGERVIRGPGQPSLMINLVEDAAFAAGVSIMPDAVSVVLTDLAGNIRAQSIDAMSVDKRDIVVAHIGAVLDRLAQEAGVDRARIFGLGIATTGYFVAAASVNTPADMDDWALLDLEDNIAEALNLPVWLENDGSAAAAGESLYGVGQRHRSFAYLHVAAGLGGGLVLDGRLVRGFSGNAGEFTGVLPPDQRANRPTLTLLLELVRERGVEVESISALVERFDPSWPGVETWLERTRASATAIVSAAAAILDPEVIVIGGRAPKALATMMADRLSFYGVPVRGRERRFPAVLAAETVGDAAAMGAAALPVKDHFFG